MPEEQIKQNAEEYASDKNYRTCNPSWWAQIDFIAGAHSRDEEIKELKKEVSALETVIVTARAATSTQEAIIKDLRNPWISVEQRLPPVKIRVLFLDKNGKVWLGRNTIAMQAELETDENNNLLPPPTVPPCKPVITHWMPIPELPKGGEK